MTIIYPQAQKVPRNEFIGNTIQFRYGISTETIDKTAPTFNYDFTNTIVEILIKQTKEESSLVKLLTTEDSSITVWNTNDVPLGQGFNISADISADQTELWGEVKWFYELRITDSTGTVKTRFFGPLNIQFSSN